MNLSTEIDINLTVRSFAYVAKQLARSCAALGSSARYEQIINEAEKHRSALRMVQRDVFERVEQGLRHQTLTSADCHKVRETATQRIARAQQTITRIAEQYAPHKLA